MQQTQFGSYFIQAKLGTGRIGTVYKAFNQRGGMWVALRVLHPHLDAPLFEQQSQLASHLNHPHIVRIEEVGSVAGQSYSAMEFIEGGTLSDHFRNYARISLPACARLIDQIASALDNAHAQGVIHGDLKLDNILLARPEHAVISDFGIVSVLNPAIPPSVQADVDALLDIAYLLAVGKPRLNETLPSKINPRLPRTLDPVLLNRYESAGELAAAFSGAIEAHERQKPLVVAAPPRRKKRDRRLTAAGVLVLGLAVLAMAVALIVSQDQEEITPVVEPIISLQPTATETPLPTDTRIPSPTSTAAPSQTPTDTLTPTESDTDTPTPTATPQPIEVRVIGSQRVNLRSGPGTNYEGIGRAAPGDTFMAIGYVVDQPLWYLVILPEGGKGWISSEFVETAAEIETLPTADFITPTPRNTVIPSGNNQSQSQPQSSEPRPYRTVQITLTGGWQNTGVVVTAGETLRITGTQSRVSGRVGGTNLAIGDSYQAAMGTGGLLELMLNSGDSLTVEITIFR